MATPMRQRSTSHWDEAKLCLEIKGPRTLELGTVCCEHAGESESPLGSSEKVYFLSCCQLLPGGSLAPNFSGIRETGSLSYNTFPHLSWPDKRQFWSLKRGPFEPTLVSNPSPCVRCTVRPNKSKGQSLEQRKVH